MDVAMKQVGFIAAEPGRFFNVQVFVKQDEAGQFLMPDKSDIYRLPVVAWELFDNGWMRPRTPSPSADLAQPSFVIEDTLTGILTGYHVSNLSGAILFRDEASWWEHMINNWRMGQGSPAGLQ